MVRGLCLVVGYAMNRIISERVFAAALRERLAGISAKSVTGPGRSGAIASVYASHLLGIPFLPYGQPCPDTLRPLLIVDTAISSGRTLRKAARAYGEPCVVVAVFDEPPRVRFWYEACERLSLDRKETSSEPMDPRSRVLQV